MYRYIISPNQTYIPINDSEYIVLEELRYSSDKNKQSLYSEIMEDIKITVSEISNENRTNIMEKIMEDIKRTVSEIPNDPRRNVITKKNANLLVSARTILSLRNLRKI